MLPVAGDALKLMKIKKMVRNHGNVITITGMVSRHPLATPGIFFQLSHQKNVYQHIFMLLAHISSRRFDHFSKVAYSFVFQQLLVFFRQTDID